MAPQQKASESRERGARTLALALLLDRERKRIPLDRLLHRVQDQASLAPAERALLHELVYGVYRWRNRLDWIIDHLVEKRPEKLPLSIRYILRLGLYQLLFLERIPPFAAVHETVELAKRFGHRGTANLVNGVLREAYRQRSDLPYPPWDRDPIGYLTVVESHPRWMVERWVATWGVERARQICEANNRRPPLTLRTNTLRTTRTALLQLLQEAGIAATPSPLLPESIRLLEHPGLLTSLPGYSQGWFQVQDEGAMLVSYLLAPYPGNCLLDACAAPGGKTTHCAALSQDQGIIIALDRSRKRLYRLQENCQRLGIRSIHPVQGDAGALPFGHPFDLVLCDAPCSGLGVLRRHPEGKWEKEETLIEEMRARQSHLLEQLALAVRRGGVLVYSVCSFEPEETEEVVRRFLQSHPAFTPDPLSPLLPAALTPFLDSSHTSLRLFPGDLEMDGGFVIRLRRT